MMKEHQPGIHEGFLVKRKIKLQGLKPEKLVVLEQALRNVIGVDTLSLQANPMLLKISYDASMTDTDSLLAVLAEEGVSPDSGWWTQYKLNWSRQIDANIKANSKQQPHCCGKPPPGK